MSAPSETWHPVFEHTAPRRRFAADSAAARGPGVCLSVASQKGGVGKTTTAINLAAGLGLAGAKVLLFDLDPQANATSGVGHGKLEELPPIPGVRGRPTILDFVRRDDACLPLVRETIFENLWVLPSIADLARIERVQSLFDQDFDYWKNLADSLRARFDVVLLDCPPSLGGIPTLALSVSDQVLIPVQCEYYAMEGLSQILPVIEEVQSSRRPQLRIAGLLLTMYSEELDLSRDIRDEVERYFPDLVYPSPIPRDVAFAESSSHGMPIFYYSPFSRGAWSYLELSREVHRREVLSHEQSETG